MNQPNYADVKAVRRTKIETTYEYVPLIGQILGYWRVQKVNRIGSDFELHIKTPLSEYDRVIINGEEIQTPLLPTDSTR